MTNLLTLFDTNLFEGLNLDQLFALEFKIEELEMAAYYPIGMMQESENISDTEYEMLDHRAAYLDKIFSNLRKDWSMAVEIASSKEMDEQTA